MKGWYKAAVDRTLPPSRVTLYQITAERVDLYRQVQPSEENIPISVDPFEVEDLVPTEDKIEFLVWRLRGNCSWVPSGMRAEHLNL